MDDREEHRVHEDLDPPVGGHYAAADQEKDPNLLYGPIEAQWVLNVLDDTLNKLNVCSYLTPLILRDKMIEAVDQELQVALKEHFQIEREYIQLAETLEAAARAEAEGQGPDQRTEENREIMAELDKCFSDSTRTVCRLLTAEQHNILVSRRLKELTTRRSPSVLEYIHTCQNLRLLVHAKLKMTAEEENQIREQTSELALKEKDDHARYEELLKKLKTEQREHKESTSLKQQKINRLESKIAQEKDDHKDALWTIKSETEHKEQEAKAAFEAEKAKLLQKLKDIEAKLEKDSDLHTADETALYRRVRYKAEAVEGLIQRYDQDMQSMHHQLEDLKALFAAEQKELARLELHFNRLDEENARIVLEMKEIRDKRDRDLLDERKRNHAAVLVQQLFAQHVLDAKKERKRLAKEAAKEAKAGGKGKKG